MYHLPLGRILSTALTSGSYGVNVQIGALAGAGLLLAGDVAPPTFAAGAIADEGQDPNVANRSFPAPTDAEAYEPALAILQLASWDIPGELYSLAGSRHAKDLKMLLAYRSSNVDTAHAARDWAYTCRAIVRCLRILMTQAHEAERKLAAVNLTSLDSITVLAPFAPREGVVATGGLILGLEVRDIAP